MTMDEAKERATRARRTLEMVQRVHPGANPTPEDVAAFHELHAEHERAAGRPERAAEAERRAERARQRG